tara:strand:+ start:424 stop:579 length:156 start_codon:yes stop_codon:yes gene_type:complete
MMLSKRFISRGKPYTNKTWNDQLERDYNEKKWLDYQETVEFKKGEDEINSK